jgi:tRNA nucleotidyltransferase/poly(A) polymerase
MLHFDHLDILDKHINFLRSKIKTKQAIFLVGGCVRDLLLGIEKAPSDIDLTLADKPEVVYKAINTQGLSHFMTEKFGTITLINKEKSQEIKYELTPLRTE